MKIELNLERDSSNRYVHLITLCLTKGGYDGCVCFRTSDDSREIEVNIKQLQRTLAALQDWEEVKK